MQERKPLFIDQKDLTNEEVGVFFDLVTRKMLGMEIPELPETSQKAVNAFLDFSKDEQGNALTPDELANKYIGLVNQMGDETTDLINSLINKLNEDSMT